MSASAFTQQSFEATKSEVTDPDYAEAERFLKLLDPIATSWTFQTFDDDKKRKDGSLVSVLHGSLEERRDELAELNQRGAGVFVTVNKTDGNGRKKENIVGVRAIWQEADRPDVPQLPLTPHIVVESSPGKYHRYVRVEGAPIDEFAAVEQRLVDDYGSDPGAMGINRVLRLPGFLHQKNPQSPHQVRIVEASGEPPIAWEKVKDALPPVERRKTAPAIPETEPAAPGSLLENPAEIASALAVLDPDIGYQDWLQVGMALHSTGGGREAFDLWDRWSQHGICYRPGECAYRWATFTRGGGVTIRTLFDMAWKAGWDGEISSREEILPLVEAQERRMLAAFGKHHAVAMMNGKAVVVYRERDATRGCMTTRFTTPRDLHTKYQPSKLPCVVRTKDGVRIDSKPLVAAWMVSPIRKTYDQVVFKPVAGLVAGDSTLADGEILNLYQGLTIQPQKGDCQLILDHIREVWCSGDENAFQYVIHWLARMVQKPHERGHTVIVLRSGEGTGKNIIIDIFVRAFGEHATIAMRPEDLTGRFNDHLGTSVLVFANEAVWGGDKAQEGMLKGLITDEEIPVERKYLPKFRLRNSAHLIMASNNDWVAPVGLDDRRFVILDVSESRKGDAAYFHRLAEHIENGGEAAFLHHLLHLDISQFNPRILPDLGLKQATKRDAKVRGFDSITQWWVHCLEEGQLLQEHHVTSSIRLRGGGGDWEDGPITIATQDLYDGYQDWAKKAGRRVEHSSSFGKKLAELAGAKVKRPAAKPGEERRRVYELPSLRDCRELFEAKAKMPWDWHDEALESTDDGDLEATARATQPQIELSPSQVAVAKERQQPRLADERVH